jgi:hypothetical protein
MPVSYVIETPRKLIRTACSGAVTFAEVMDHFRQLKEDPACTGHLDVLLDLREAESTPDSDQLRTVNYQLAIVRPKAEFGLCAIIASRDAMFGMMRMFGVFAEENFRAIRTFRELAEAETWLGLKQGGDR